MKFTSNPKWILMQCLLILKCLRHEKDKLLDVKIQCFHLILVSDTFKIFIKL